QAELARTGADLLRNHEPGPALAARPYDQVGRAALVLAPAREHHAAGALHAGRERDGGLGLRTPGDLELDRAGPALRVGGREAVRARARHGEERLALRVRLELGHDPAVAV